MWFRAFLFPSQRSIGRYLPKLILGVFMLLMCMVSDCTSFKAVKGRIFTVKRALAGV